MFADRYGTETVPLPGSNRCHTNLPKDVVEPAIIARLDNMVDSKAAALRSSTIGLADRPYLSRESHLAPRRNRTERNLRNG